VGDPALVPLGSSSDGLQSGREHEDLIAVGQLTDGTVTSHLVKAVADE
jgi:hypothetical protein